METDDKQRFVHMAEDYDQVAPFLVPMYDFVQQEMIRLADLASLSRPRIIDLGAGSGLFLEKVLATCPHASCYWVDSSEGFLAVAKRRLEQYGEQVTYILSPMEGDWPVQIDGPVDRIFSMSAIHHLERQEKQALYARCFDLLADDGWFINGDEMKTFDESAYRASLAFWVRHVESQAACVPPSLLDNTQRWLRHFDGWKRRNIERIDRPKTKGDDLHEPFVDQVQWLKDIGYEAVDIFVKYHLWCVVGGRKPQQR
jgi:tRNA (cmo5U34)-methyltransferase